MSKAQQRVSPSATGRLRETRAGRCRARKLLRAVFSALAGLSAAVAAAAADSQPGELEEIVVYASQVTLPDAYAGGQVARGWRAGMLGNIDMMESPFAGTSFTSELMLAQQAISVADVLQNDPVVRVAKGFGNFQELYMIRGFPVFSDDMTYNGVYGILPRQFVAAELLERVEVFRGASAFLNGAAPGGSSLGGAVNLVPKRATESDLTRLTVGYTDQSHGVLALDASRRFGANDSTGVRLNLVRRDGETSVDGQDRALDVIALGLDHRGERLRLSADVGYQDHRIDEPRPSVTPLGAIPDAPDASSNFAQPWTYTDERQLFAVARAEYDIGARSRVWLAAGFRDGEEENVLSNPNADASGATSAFRFDNAREDDVLSGDMGFNTLFATGNIGHDVTVSASAFSLESANAFAFSSFAGFAGDLYQPVAVSPPAADFFLGGDLNAPLVTEETETRSVAIADTLSFLEGQLLVTLGARHQTIEVRSYDFSSGEPLSSYDESRVTPVAGLVFQPGDSLSLYANYIEGLLPGDIAPSSSGGVPVSNAGEVFEPYRARQTEVGVKYDANGLGGSLSAFTTSRPRSYVEDGVFSTFGEQENRGIELTFFGALGENLRVLGGATLLEAELADTQGGLLDGNSVIGTPETQINLNVEWDPAAVPGLTLEARGLYTDSQYADEANTVSVSSWSRIDLGARFRTRIATRDVSLRARLQNVGDNDYWASVGGFPGSNYLVLAEPRTFLVSASIDL